MAAILKISDYITFLIVAVNWCVIPLELLNLGQRINFWSYFSYLKIQYGSKGLQEPKRAKIGQKHKMATY